MKFAQMSKTHEVEPSASLEHFKPIMVESSNILFHKWCFYETNFLMHRFKSGDV